MSLDDSLWITNLVCPPAGRSAAIPGHYRSNAIATPLRPDPTLLRLAIYTVLVEVFLTGNGVIPQIEPHPYVPQTLKGTTKSGLPRIYFGILYFQLQFREVSIHENND